VKNLHEVSLECQKIWFTLQEDSRGYGSNKIERQVESFITVA
jgi:hypothetical protein